MKYAGNLWVLASTQAGDLFNSHTTLQIPRWETGEALIANKPVGLQPAEVAFGSESRVNCKSYFTLIYYSEAFFHKRLEIASSLRSLDQ